MTFVKSKQYARICRRCNNEFKTFAQYGRICDECLEKSRNARKLKMQPKNQIFELYVISQVGYLRHRRQMIKKIIKITLDEVESIVNNKKIINKINKVINRPRY